MTFKESVRSMPTLPYIFWVRAGRDSSTTRTDPEQNRAMQGQDQDGTRTRCSTRQAEHVRGPSPPPSPGLGGLGSVGGYVRHGTAKAPSRPALLTRSGSCTQNCEHFKNEVVEKLIGIQQPVGCVAWQEAHNFVAPCKGVNF